MEVRTRERPAPVQPVANPLDDPKSQLAQVIGQVEKLHGTQIMHRGNTLPTFRHIPFGIFTLDMATFGGIPEGLITEVFGWEHSGKSTHGAYRVIAAAQKKYPNKTAVLIEPEGTYTPTWAARQGVDTDRLLVVRPQSGEQAMDIADAVLRAQETSVVVLDSLPALVPMKEIDASAEDALVGIQARMIGRFLRKANQAMIEARKNGLWPTLVCINQWRMKIGVMHGDPRTTPGGVSKNFFFSLRVEMKNKEIMGKDSRDNDVVDHNDHSFKLHKNKIGNGIREAEFCMIRNPDNPLGQGFIDDGKTVVVFGRRFGLITGGGSSWRVDGLDEKFGKLDEIVEYFYSDLELFDQFKRRLITLQRQAMGLVADGWY